MAQTWNEELLDAMIRHQIGILRFDAGVRNRIWAILDATEADMRAQIANRLRRNTTGGLTPANLNRIESLLKGLRKTRVDAWSKVSALMFEEMRAYAISEPAFQVQILESIFPVELGLTLPDPARLRAIVSKSAFDGETLTSMLARVKAADVRRIEQGVRIGMIQGESIPEIGRRILGTVGLRGTNGLTEITRRNAATIVRTAVNGVGAETLCRPPVEACTRRAASSPKRTPTWHRSRCSSRRSTAARLRCAGSGTARCTTS